MKIKKLIASILCISLILIQAGVTVFAEYAPPIFTGNYRIENQSNPQNVPENTVISQELGTVNDSSGSIIYYYSLTMPEDGICNIEISKGGNYGYLYTVIKFDDPKIENVINGEHEIYVDEDETCKISPELKKGTYVFYVSAQLIPELHKNTYTNNFSFKWTFEPSAKTEIPAPKTEETPATPTEPSTTGFDLKAIPVGVKLNWNSQKDCIGYRLYRSEISGDDGESVTDFYITDNEFIDVNVDANKTYYYTVRALLVEAKPYEGIPEKLGSASTQIKVNTGSEIVGGNASDSTSPKKFILMTLDNPYMSVNGVRAEIDPGRSTTPLILKSRTMVPIRAIVEAMNGSVDWNDASRKISLSYKMQTVVMTLDNKTITVNGSSKAIDVAPTAINSRTMVPIRFAAENLGCDVDWLNSTRQIVIVYR